MARALETLPKIADAMRRGELSDSKVRALTRVATPDNEGALVDVGRAGSAEQVERIVRGLRRGDREDARRYFRPVRGGRRNHRRARSLGPGNGSRVRQGARGCLAGGLDQGTRGDRYQVVVHVDAGTLAAEPAAGTSVLEARYVPAGTSRRVSCDASRMVMTHDHDEDGPVRDVGRKTRVVSPGLRRALTHRDRTCRFPGCSVTYCEAYHLTHWANGGATSLDNLVLLC